ncbi:MAG: hypothetical protein M1836_003859 [Candelina mexicana]|nr:MAG: hypothetical protein M1836_003859 [Candelina mexicana]
MRASKSSFAIGRAQNDQGEHQLHRSQTRSSLDTLIIHGRVRIPSARDPTAEPIDSQIARGLLNPATFNVLSRVDPNVPNGQLPETEQSQLVHPLKIGRSGQLRTPAFDGPNNDETPSRLTSATWTTISNRVFTDSSDHSSDRVPADFAGEYNRLAQKHGLPTLMHSLDLGVHGSEQTEGPNILVRPQRSNWFMRKILRKAASTHNVKSPAKKPLARRLSVASIPDRGRKDTLRGRTLEELARLGGISIFVLPPAFAAARLAIPTCFSATATFLSQYGRTTPGIFRVPGQLSTVNALYDHYAHQLEHAEKDGDQVQQTVGSGLLPTHITPNVHDVASAFKKFIAGLPGGILGTMPLLKTLRDINTLLKPNPDLPESQKTKLRARLIALAIASLSSDHQTALISAVLGLTALVARAAEEASNGNEHERVSWAAELMTCRSLGVVFGPLLFGNRTEEIDLTPENNRGSLLVVPRSPQKRRRERRKNVNSPKKLGNDSLALSVERAKVTAGIMEMLVSDWEDVVRQFRNIGVTEPQQSMPEPEIHVTTDNSKLGARSPEEPRQAQPNSDIEGSLRIKKSRSKGKSSLASFKRTRHLGHEASEGTSSPEQPATYTNKQPELLSLSQATLIDDRGMNEQSTVPKNLAESGKADRNQPPCIAYLSHGIGCDADSDPKDMSTADARKRNAEADSKSGLLEPEFQGHDFLTEPTVNAHTPLSDTCPALQPTKPLDEPWYPAIAREDFGDLTPQTSEQVAIHEEYLGATSDDNTHNGNLALGNRGSKGLYPSPKNKYEDLDHNHANNLPLPVDSPSASLLELKGVLGDNLYTQQVSSAPREARHSIRTFDDLPNKGIPILESSLSRSSIKRIITPTKQNQPFQRSVSLSRTGSSTDMPRLNVLLRSQTVSSADRHIKTLPYNEEPPVAQHIHFRYSRERLRSQSDTSSQQDLNLASASKGNATLYAEIRRLQRQVELRTEEAQQAHRQLEAMRNYRDSGTLSEKLREVQRGLKTWKNRAEWAEKRLLMQDCERRRSFAATDVSEHPLIEEGEKDSRRATVI